MQQIFRIFFLPREKGTFIKLLVPTQGTTFMLTIFVFPLLSRPDNSRKSFIFFVEKKVVIQNF